MVSSFVNPSKSGHGRFYTRAVNDPATPASEVGTFAGMLVKMKNYVVTRRGVITSQILTAAEEALVPTTPTLARADGGTGPIPTDRLAFTSGDFAGKEGATFAAMKWRLAEVTDPSAPGFNPYDRTTPRAYEITASWESEELTTFQSTLTMPAVGARPGGTYRARVKHKDSTGRWSHWSAPVQFTAAEPDVQPYLDALVVSQFMYNPAPPTPAEAAVAADAQEYEWIELLNVGAVPLDLTPIRLTKGVDFDFAGSAVTSLPAGGRVVVVKNPAAFTARYGTAFPGVSVAGAWQSGQSLNNGGEEIKVSHGAGTPVREFAYTNDPPWPDGADGSGHGLVLVDPASRPAHALGTNWRLSTQRGGSPGASDTVTYDQWSASFGGLLPADDSDADGYTNFAEYALGLPPRSAAGPVPLEGLAVSDAGAAYFEVRVRQQLGAEDAQVVLEASTTLGAWDAATPAYQLHSTQPNGDGTATMTYRRWLLPGAAGSEFVRVRVRP
jgi:hypothetical protein